MSRRNSIRPSCGPVGKPTFFVTRPADSIWRHEPAAEDRNQVLEVMFVDSGPPVCDFSGPPANHLIGPMSDRLQASFMNLLDRHHGIVLTVASLYCWRAEDRRDLAQEIVLQL